LSCAESISCDIWRNGNSDFSRISCILENPAKSLLNARYARLRETPAEAGGQLALAVGLALLNTLTDRAIA
jgi:hypothetical protein